MPNHRTPNAKADVSGASAKNPQRFRDRKGPKRTRPVGEPYKNMTESQKEQWHEVVECAPWLHSAHRQLLRAFCVAAANIAKGQTGGGNIQALSSIASKLALTPVDETKVLHGDGDSDDPADEFFTTH